MIKSQNIYQEKVECFKVWCNIMLSLGSYDIPSIDWMVMMYMQRKVQSRNTSNDKFMKVNGRMINLTFEIFLKQVFSVVLFIYVTSFYTFCFVGNLVQNTRVQQFLLQLQVDVFNIILLLKLSRQCLWFTNVKIDWYLCISV